MAETKTPTRAEMARLIAEQRQLLEDALAKLTPRQMTQPGVTDAGWSAKDVMAHLAEWEQMFLGWHRAGLRGEVPITPAPGYTWSWNSLHALNERIYRKHRRKSLAAVRHYFHESHQDVLREFERMSEDDLNRPGRWAWTGKGTLAGALTANTWRHYHWARTLIDKWRKAEKRRMASEEGY
jgi:hypothetical protein